MATAGRPAKVLDMIALDAGEAADFLASAFGAEDEPADAGVLPAGVLAPPAPAAQPSAEERENAPSLRWLKIHVDDPEDSRPRVTVDVPLDLLRLGLRVGRSLAPALEQVDWAEVDAAAAGGGEGLLLDANAGDGERIRIYLE